MWKTTKSVSSLSLSGLAWALILGSVHASAAGQFTYHDAKSGIRGKVLTDDHSDGRMDEGAIPLVRTEHHHIGKRSAHLQLLAPTNNITLDWSFRKFVSEFEFEACH